MSDQIYSIGVDESFGHTGVAVLKNGVLLGTDRISVDGIQMPKRLSDFLEILDLTILGIIDEAGERAFTNDTEYVFTREGVFGGRGVAQLQAAVVCDVLAGRYCVSKGLNWFTPLPSQWRLFLTEDGNSPMSSDDKEKKPREYNSAMLTRIFDAGYDLPGLEKDGTELSTDELDAICLATYGDRLYQLTRAYKAGNKKRIEDVVSALTDDEAACLMKRKLTKKDGLTPKEVLMLPKTKRQKLTCKAINL